MTNVTIAPSRLFADLSPAEEEAAAVVLAACRTRTLEPGVAHFDADFPADALVAVEEGFVVVRASGPSDSRSIVTCEAGPGEVVLPPAADEALVALSCASVRLIDAEARMRLLASPFLAERVFERLALALRHKQEATAEPRGDATCRQGSAQAPAARRALRG